MWQRIQTVFLVILIMSLVASILLPIWAGQDEAGKSHLLYALHYSVRENGTILTTSYLPYSLTAFLLVAAITIAIIEIRRYKNRLLQMKLGALNSLFIAGSMIAAFYFANELRAVHGGVFGFGLWLPGLAVVCNLLANQFIRRDERIVRDSERLR